MSKHEVLTGVSNIGKSKKRLRAGDVLDSTLVTEDELAFFLRRGAIGPAKAKTAPPKTVKEAMKQKPVADTADDWDGSQAQTQEGD